MEGKDGGGLIRELMEEGVFLESTNVITPLGMDTSSVLEAVAGGESGIRICTDPLLSPHPFPAALLNWDEVEQKTASLVEKDRLTRFEKLCVLSVREALRTSKVDPSDPATVLILSSTKGNVDLLENDRGFSRDRLHLWNSAAVVARTLGMVSTPRVVSNACISGVVAMLLARHLLNSGICRHAIVVGADLVSRFIVSGFQSFLSLSDQACRPYDAGRNGLTLGEAAGTMIFSAGSGGVCLLGGATSNDANHISGPSRTGEGLYQAISRTLRDASIPGIISAHGTATIYNDEMESIALTRSGLEQVPVNSLKGCLGHTLGTAGIIETVLNLAAVERGILLPTYGYKEHGVSGKIRIQKETGKAEVRDLLKIASGFGGCNAAALFRRKP